MVAANEFLLISAVIYIANVLVVLCRECLHDDEYFQNILLKNFMQSKISIL